MLTKLDFLEFDLELTEQSLIDHDGSELSAQQQIDEIKKEIQKWER